MTRYREHRFDPASKKAFDEMRMPERTRLFVAQTLCLALDGGREMPMEQACFLARQWAAILERLQALGCLPRGVPGTHSLPWMPELKRCPWNDEHGWKDPDKPWATAPVLGNQFKGDYYCPICAGRRKYIDLVGLLGEDWDAQYQEAAAGDSLLALPVATRREAQR